MLNANEYFWSIVLEPGSVTAAVWTRKFDETEVLAIGQSIPWNETEELVAAVDAALSSAVEGLPETSTEPTKTVFGVVPAWVEEGQIQKKHLATIREISEKLSLTPIGFVILPEALAHEIKHSEGAPVTGVIIGVNKQSLDVSVYRLGNLLGTVQVGRSVSIFEDVIEGLSRFRLQGEAIPSRFILYGGNNGELTEAKDTLTLADWKENGAELTFLHTPQIVVSDANQKAIALSFAGSSEMGEVKRLSVPGEVEENTGGASNELTDLGFISEGDIANVKPIDENHAVAGERTIKLPSVLSSLKQKFFSRNTHLPNTPNTHMNNTHEHIHTIQPQPFVAKRRPFFFKLPGKSNSKMMLGGGIVGVILLLIFAWWYFPKADILVYVAPQIITGRADLTLNTESSSLDLSNHVVPAKVVSTTVSGDKTVQASGSKTTGDKAHGKVTIRNGTSLPVKLAAGAFLAKNSDIRFSLDESASVSGAESPTTPGTLEVSVTAEKIGSDFNTAKDESLSVSNYPKSEVDAVVSADGITGGTSRQVVAVSKSDIDSATNQLIDELKAQSTSDLSKNVSEEEAFIASTLVTKISSKTVSAKVGDEANEVTVSISMDASGVSIAKHDLTEMATNILNPDVPSGFTLRPEQIDAKFSVTGSQSPLPAQLTLSAHLLPNTNPDDIVRKALGTRPERISEVLRDIPGFVRAEVSLKPKLPSFLRIIPLRKKSVTISIVSAE